MESNRLGAEEVVAGGKIGGNGEGAFATVGIEGLGSPDLGAGVVAVLGDFEPGRGAVGFGGIGNFGHVDDYGSEVVAANGFGSAVAVAGLLVHLYREGLAGYNT